ncbi:MAG: DUF2065 domain-containing protein [Gammaproteobacteria bacterium]|nr:MAG: DUF2065 domain-containing protein [Gammaproteobacteria bacterium]
MWQTFLLAFSLLLILEGIMPFLNPAAYRRMLLAASRLDDRTLRVCGFGAMLTGLLLMYGVS